MQVHIKDPFGGIENANEGPWTQCERARERERCQVTIYDDPLVAG